MNFWEELAERIAALDKSDPKYLRKIQGEVKRFVHAEKASVYHRTFLHYRHVLSRRHKNNLRLQAKNHRRMAILPDDEVVTW